LIVLFYYVDGAKPFSGRTGMFVISVYFFVQATGLSHGCCWSKRRESVQTIPSLNSPLENSDSVTFSDHQLPRRSSSQLSYILCVSRYRDLDTSKTFESLAALILEMHQSCTKQTLLALLRLPIDNKLSRTKQTVLNRSRNSGNLNNAREQVMQYSKARVPR